MNEQKENTPLNIAQIDRHAMRAAFEKAATSYDAVAVLQQEVADRLVERMDYMSMKPR